MSYQSMLWALRVTDSPLDRDHDLDLECLPLLGRWCLSGLLPRVGVLPLRRSESCPSLHEDLQHELKWFLKPHLWHFLPKAGQSLNWWVVLHLLHILLSRVLWPLVLCEPLVLVPFLPLRLNVLIASTVIGCVIPPFNLWWIEIFDCHFMLFSVLEQCLVCHVLSFISSIAPISLPRNAWSHEIRVPFYIPVSPRSSTGIFQQDSWFSDQVGWLTHCHLVWCHYRSRRCGSNMRWRLQGCLLWLWKLSLDLSEPPHQWILVVCSTAWNLLYWDNQWLLQTRYLWLMLDAHNANVIWPFHSSNASCWSSACQSNFGGWKTSCPPAMILEID